MINIGIVRDKEGFIWQFTVKGHARFAKAGRDIVCAAISVTAQTAIGALEDLAGLKNFYTQKHGYIRCTIPADIPSDKKQIAGIILETTAIGFRQVEMVYEDYVSVLDEEV
ncbi:MAG: ribosomal-processing cysteine protease Prp [Clostridia bacterium]|nr:ribosomal-processing cysteine protease Prp [Clostridia bacterium]